MVLVVGSRKLDQEDHYNAPVQLLPHHGHNSHLLYHLKLHLHLGAAAAALVENWDRKTITVRRNTAQPSETLDSNAMMNLKK